MQIKFGGILFKTLIYESDGLQLQNSIGFLSSLASGASLSNFKRWSEGKDWAVPMNHRVSQINDFFLKGEKWIVKSHMEVFKEKKS